MKVVVIDGQGGKIGHEIIGRIKAEVPGCTVTAVGTNSIATSAMLKGGADNAATGENAVAVNSRRADVIIGPIGIVIADSLYGEITPAMAAAVGQSEAVKLLLPINQCSNIVVGVGDLSIGALINEAIEHIRLL